MSQRPIPARPGAIATRLLEDGRELTLYPMIYTFRLCVGEYGSDGFADAWCYEHLLDACAAFGNWDGQDDPPGRWIRHLGTRRRRRYHEDCLEREWVAP